MTQYDDTDTPYYFGEVIGSASCYHLPSCHLVTRIYSRNYKRLRNWKEAVELGLSPCYHCRPPYIPESDQNVPLLGMAEISPLTATHLSDLRRELLRVLDAIESETNQRLDGREGLAGRINRLSRADIIPREVAACMKAVTEARNVAEYDNRTLSQTQSAAVLTAWAAVKEWAIAQGIKLANW